MSVPCLPRYEDQLQSQPRAVPLNSLEGRKTGITAGTLLTIPANDL